MKAVLMVSVIAVLVASSWAQPVPNIEWERTYGGIRNEWGHEAWQMPDSGFVMGGTTASYGAGAYDFWLVRTRPNGDTLWTRTYGTSDTNSCYSVVPTYDGGFILAGESGQMSANTLDGMLVKVDSSGNEQWRRIIGGSLNDRFWEVIQNSDSGYTVVGWTFSYGAASGDLWLVRTHPDGTVMWNRRFGGNAYDAGYALKLSTDGGYLVAGKTTSYGAGGEDFWLLKTNANGNLLWSHTYGGTANDACYFVQELPNGNILLTGETSSYGAGGSDVWVVVTRSTGDSLMSRTYGGGLNDIGEGIYETADGGYVLFATTSSYGHGGSDLWLVKLDSAFNVLWTRTYGGSDTEVGYCNGLTLDGGYFLGGWTYSSGAGANDFYLVKTGPDSTCTTPRAPEITITVSGSNADLWWNPVTESVGGCPITVTHYLVFCSPTSEGPFYYHGGTTDTVYTHQWVVNYASGMFYQVVAVTGPLPLYEQLPGGGVLSMEAVLARLRYQ